MQNLILAALPAVCFTLFFIFFSTANAGRCRCPQRTAFLHAAMAVYVTIFLSTELLSARHLLRQLPAATLWITVCTATILAIILQRRHRNIPFFLLPRLSRFDMAMVGSLIVFFSIETIIALAAPPNNWDSMTYHMGRVMHWLRNNGTAFYPTNCFRQLYLAPGAEMATLQMTLLAQNDRLVNLVQLFSMVGTVVGVSMVDRELGGARRVQIFAAVFTATIPMAILQSTGTQNDLVESFWTICFVLFLLRLLVSRTWANVIATGISLGFSLLVKSTALIIVPPFIVITFAAALFRRNPSMAHPLVRNAMQLVRLKPQLPRLATWFCSAGIAAAIFAPHLYRTHEFLCIAHGKSSGKSCGLSSIASMANPNQAGDADFKVANDRMTPGIFAANFIRNCGLHLGTPSKRLNRFLDSGIRSLLGKEIENPHSTWIGSHFRVRPSLHEDEAGNPLHFSAIVLTFGLLLLRKRYRRLWPLPVYAGALVLAFILICFLLKWQPFHSRLQLPLFVCAAPLVAVVFRYLFSKPFRSFILAFFLLCSLPWLLFNAGRPLVGKKSVLTTSRIDQYFVNRPDLTVPFQRIAAEVRAQKPQTVGLALSEDDWEYPWWVLLEGLGGNAPRIEHVLVANGSRELERRPVVPDLIISSRGQTSATVGSRTYLIADSCGPFILLAPRQPVFQRSE